MDKTKLSEIAFTVIAQAGSAKSSFIEAIDLAADKKFDEAQAKIEEGRKSLLESHKNHYEVIVEESKGEQVEFSLLFVHAEDQFMSAETIGNLAERMVKMYKIIFDNNK